jgi:hypothetical protein
MSGSSPAEGPGKSEDLGPLSRAAKLSPIDLGVPSTGRESSTSPLKSAFGEIPFFQKDGPGLEEDPHF